MGKFRAFLFFLTAFAALLASGEEKKHRRGTGLLPPQKSSDSRVNPAKVPVPPPTVGNAGSWQPRSKATDADPAGGQTAAANAAGKVKSAAECPKYSLETLMKIPSAHSPQSAADGGIYFVSDSSEVPQLYRQKSPTDAPESLTTFEGGVAYYRASPAGDKILVASQVSGDEQYDIYLLVPERKSLTPLIVDRTKRVESVAWSPDGTWFAYTSNQRNKIDLDLYRFDLASMRASKLADLEGTNTVTDISPNAKQIALTAFRSVTDSDILVWTENSVRNVTHFGGKASADGAIFSADSRGLFLTSDEAGTRQMFYYPVDGAHRAKRLSSEKWDVDDFNLDVKRTALAYATNEDGYTQFHGWEIDAKGIKGKNISVPLIKNAVARHPSFSIGGDADSRAIYYALTSTTKPSDVWGWKKNQDESWTHSLPSSVDPACLFDEELVHYPSFDAKSIPGFLYTPRSFTGAGPFVVYTHGGPESQFRPRFSALFQSLLQRGFGVFAPNVRGSLGYGREFTLADNYKKRMDSVKDLIAGSHWLVANQKAKHGKLALFGGSYGGFMVLRSLEVEPELFSAACESVGITDFVTFLKNTKPYRRTLREAEYGPLADETFLKSISPMTYVGQLKTPLYVFHGANDPRVPVSEAEQLIAALKAKNVPVEFRIFADEGHGNVKLRNVLEQARLMTYFFETQLKPDEK